ncbi:hypothetical protein DLJ53_09880 [Acuticoccus sediminis]|uniref:Phosphatidic acid phosphatase type 2/haloperoxidase domain-containing protein n=1 Tax=Acuticoccus sediminis TaxID=2184697 RepID=A0A8B2NYN4_9HYPH|nr:phosphatase PAP2 family protein [Acuticoccus sediminis]RAI01710.1 hypothetical protein DLJ53_09880 [Acuticoccus sediminis]
MPIDPTGHVFPRTYWTKRFRSFVNLSNLDPAWKNIDLTPPPTNPAELHKETDELLEKKWNGRADRMAEIEFEADNLTPKFARLLVMNDTSHPATAEVIDAILIAGRLAHFYFKDKFNRCRPCQLEPDIDPVVDIPGHPSYPSGHSNQHHMIAFALTEFAPLYKQRLEEIAHRVAENREYAGVHYASDTRAGKELAQKFYPFVRKAYAPEFERARKEWPNPAPLADVESSLSLSLSL